MSQGVDAPALGDVPGFEQAAELVTTIQQLSMARTVTGVHEIVRGAARRLTGADGASFVLRDHDQCYYADEDAIGPLWKGMRFPMTACVSGWAMMNRKAVAIENIEHDDRVPLEAYLPTFVRSLAMVPIRQLDPIGAIGNYWSGHHLATPRELALLQALADSTAVAIANIYAYEELELARLDTLNRLALASEFRDDMTHAHTQRVAKTCQLIGERLGYGPHELAQIGQAAPLHDIGKLGIADAILLKQGQLTDEEYEVMKTHAAVGARLLGDSDAEVLQLAGEIAASHHERWDGRGYPYGVGEDEIPLSGRITAIADIFDALTHTRPYKGAWSVPDAIAEIERLAGSHLDPELVTVFTMLDPTLLPL